jgi:hypothetical protein
MNFRIHIALIISFFLFFCGSSPVCDDIPVLNKQVISYVKSHISKKVGRGECWDLAAQALESAGASWDHAFKFGNEVVPGKECIYPGDIIQFNGVELRYKKGDASCIESMEQHTAIVYEVKDKRSFIIADQNNGTTGRKVGLSPLDLNTVVRGTCKFYRPVQ